MKTPRVAEEADYELLEVEPAVNKIRAGAETS